MKKKFLSSLFLGGFYVLYCLWMNHLLQMKFPVGGDPRASLESENAFYYGFFEEVVRTPPGKSLWEAFTVHRTLEFPTAVNALKEFSLFPEMVMGAVFKAVGREGMDPFAFYRVCVTLIHGLLVFFLGRILYRETGHLLLSLCGPLLLMAQFGLATRLGAGGLALRENFSMPFVVAQWGVLLEILRFQGKSKASAWSKLVFFLLLSLLTWQFTPYIFWAELLVVYFLWSIGQLPFSLARNLLLAFSGANLLHVILSQGNTFFMSGLYFLTVPAMVILLTVDRVFSGLSVLKRGILFFLLVITLKILVHAFLGTDDDGHIWAFLQGKWGATRDFSARLYLCEGPFAALGPSQLRFLATGPMVGLTALGIAFWGLFRVPLFLSLTFLFLLSLILFFYAFLASRFVILLTPALCLLGPLLMGEALKKVPSFWGKLLPMVMATGISLVALLQLPKTGIRSHPRPSPDFEELFLWIKNKTPPEAAILADLALSPRIHLLTGRKVSLHPHFERKFLRERNHRMALIYGRGSEKDYFHSVAALQSDYVVIDDYDCRPPGEQKCSYQSLLQEEGGSSGTPLCDGDFLDSHFFDLVFVNKTFKVLKPRYSSAR